MRSRHLCLREETHTVAGSVHRLRGMLKTEISMLEQRPAAEQEAQLEMGRRRKTIESRDINTVSP